MRYGTFEQRRAARLAELLAAQSKPEYLAGLLAAREAKRVAVSAERLEAKISELYRDSSRVERAARVTAFRKAKPPDAPLYAPEPHAAPWLSKTYSIGSLLFGHPKHWERWM